MWSGFCLGQNFTQTLFAVHISNVDSWQAVYLDYHPLNLREWSLHPEMFSGLVSQLGDARCLPPSLHVQQQTGHVSRYRNPLAEFVDSLVAPRDQYRLIYAFPPLKLFYLFFKIMM